MTDQSPEQGRVSYAGASDPVKALHSASCPQGLWRKGCPASASWFIMLAKEHDTQSAPASTNSTGAYAGRTGARPTHGHRNPDLPPASSLSRVRAAGNESDDPTRLRQRRDRRVPLSCRSPLVDALGAHCLIDITVFRFHKDG